MCWVLVPARVGSVIGRRRHGAPVVTEFGTPARSRARAWQLGRGPVSRVPGCGLRCVSGAPTTA